MDKRLVCGWAAFIALAGWVGAAISTYAQKSHVDSQIRDSIGISAVQIQQLNGSATTHALLMLVFACTMTIPLVIVMAFALLGERDPATRPPKAIKVG